MTAFTTNPTNPPHPLPNPGPPAPRSGHLPISGPRAGFVPPDAVARESAPGAGAGPTSLAQLVSDLRLMLAAALARTQHQWDPASGPQQGDAPIGPAYVDRKVMNARADIRAALAELDELRVVVSLNDPGPRSVAPPGRGGDRFEPARPGAPDRPEADAGVRPAAAAEVVVVSAQIAETCSRPKCQEKTADLYCSERCYELDNDPNPIQPIARNKADGFGLELSRMQPQPVILPHIRRTKQT